MRFNLALAGRVSGRTNEADYEVGLTRATVGMTQMQGGRVTSHLKK